MAGKKDSKGRRRHSNQNVGRAGLPAKGDGGRKLVCPDYLGELGMEAWHEAVESLRDRKLLDHADAKCVEMFSAAYEEYREARKEVAIGGIVVVFEGKFGPQEKANPAIGVRDAAWKRCVSLLGEMGFSPASRRKFQEGSSDDKDDLLTFLSEHS